MARGFTRNRRPEFPRSNSMYPDLQKELDTFERRTPKSAEAHKKNLKRIPLGVASNYRALRSVADLRERSQRQQVSRS